MKSEPRKRMNSKAKNVAWGVRIANIMLREIKSRALLLVMKSSSMWFLEGGSR